MSNQQSTPQSRPVGVGLAVVFFWALGVQLIAQGVAAPLGRLGVGGGSAGSVFRLAGAALMLSFGELVRRRAAWARVAAAGLLIALTVGGVLNAVRLLTGHGSAALVLSTVVMLTWAPWIAARLLGRAAAEWFAAPDRSSVRGRLNGAWLPALAGWSVAWGVLVAWSQSL